MKNAYLVNLESHKHLRDARHAHQIYAERNFEFAPKTKYMYHVSFVPNDDVGNNADSKTFKFQKEIGVLVKSADLPSFRASIENKQQYNRKKNVQTRVDYQDCRIAFHDDNIGVTRALLEEYYRYYFDDANKTIGGNDSAYGQRDKYSNRVPNYGLNNAKKVPFFKSITIYQLARRDWVAYTLVNPLLTAWDHGSVASAGSEFNENTISVAYEAVQYSSGDVATKTPAGFADAATGYDVEPSPLGYLDNAMSIDGNQRANLPSEVTKNSVNKAFENTNSPSRNSIKQASTGVIDGVVANVLSQTKLPVPDPQNRQTSSTSTSDNSTTLSGSLVNAILAKPGVATQVLPSLINSGALSNVNINDYNSASASQKAAYDTQITNKITGNDIKLIQVASNAINILGY